MDNSIEYVPLVWHNADGYWYLARFTNPDRPHLVYGPFDDQEALHAGDVWGVPFVSLENHQ